MQANDAPKRLGFGVFEVDLRDRQLTKRGLRVRLQEQPFQVLAMLLERPGEVVTRDELRNRLWPNTVVEFDHGLNKAISKIREVLGDSVESPRFVETVARRGYRFLADVAVIDIPDRQRELTPDALASPSDTAPVDRTGAGASSKQAVRPYVWSLVFGLALVLTVLKAFASRWPRFRRAERRRRGGRKRVAFRQPSDHGAVDPDICRQAHLG